MMTILLTTDWGRNNRLSALILGFVLDIFLIWSIAKAVKGV